MDNAPPDALIVPRLVMDSSVTLAWCFEDEASGYADGVLARLPESEALVPALWPLEVTNVLLVGERRGRIVEADTARFLALLGGLPIRTQPALTPPGWNQVMALGRQFGLSAYDAAYLDLALREGLPLATLDGRLRAAMTALGVAMFPAP